MPVTVTITYEARADRTGEAAEELRKLIATVVASEPDCSGIRLFRDADDPARILLVEEWSSREAYLGPHFRTPHLQAFIAAAGELFAGPPEIRFWTPGDERSPARHGG